MSRRERLLALLRGDGTEPVFSPLIDGLYAAWALGKKWISPVTWEDKFRVADRCRAALFEATRLGDLPALNPALRTTVEVVEETEERVRRKTSLHTPFGDLVTAAEERPHQGCWAVPDPADSSCGKPDQQVRQRLQMPDWYLSEQEMAAGRDHQAQIREDVQQSLATLGDRGVVFTWSGDVFHFEGFFGMGKLFLYHGSPETCRPLMDRIFELDLFRVTTALRAGVDVVMLTVPRPDTYSPRMIEEMHVPYAMRMRDWVREHGAFSHIHNCGKMERLIRDGFYQRLAPSLLETFSLPPEGDIASLEDARRRIPSTICTRGNISLGLLRNGTPDQISGETRRILGAAHGYRHIVGTADAVLNGTPLENLEAMAKTVEKGGYA